EVTGVRQNRVGNVRYSIGRFLAPSSVGSRRETDQLQVQYLRPLGPRLAFNGAVRLWRDRRIGNDDGNRDGDRARAELALRGELTRTLYLAGGYRYSWQDLERNADD